MRNLTTRALRLVLGALVAGLRGIRWREPAHGGTFTAYGPQTYQRTTGVPVPVPSSFSVRGPSAPYTLKIYNGDRAGIQSGDRVSSAVRSLNGAVIVGPRNFCEKDHRDWVPGQVASFPNQPDQLLVELRSKPGQLLLSIPLRRDDKERSG